MYIFYHNKNILTYFLTSVTETQSGCSGVVLAKDFKASVLRWLWSRPQWGLNLWQLNELVSNSGGFQDGGCSYSFHMTGFGLHCGLDGLRSQCPCHSFGESESSTGLQVVRFLCFSSCRIKKLLGAQRVWEAQDHQGKESEQEACAGLG